METEILNFLFQNSGELSYSGFDLFFVERGIAENQAIGRIRAEGQRVILRRYIRRAEVNSQRTLHPYITAPPHSFKIPSSILKISAETKIISLRKPLELRAVRLSLRFRQRLVLNLRKSTGAKISLGSVKRLSEESKTTLRSIN